MHGLALRHLRCLLRIIPVLALAVATVAHAQAWPAAGKPVRVVVPFAPGGTTDLMARLLAQQLAQSTGGQFVVDSKPGASGAIGSIEVARAAPDGHTLLVTTSSTHSIAPALSSQLRYDAVKDFTPIAHLGDSPLIILASPTVGVRSMAELLELARKRPGYLNYTSSGVGTIAHLTFEALKAQTGVSMTHVPYKGTGAAIADLTSGVVHLSLDAVATGVPHVTGGRLRGMAVTGPRRSQLAPDVPAVDETVPGFRVVTWFGLYGPRGMSPELTRRIGDEVVKVLQSPEMTQRLRTMGLDPGPTTPADFAAMVAADRERWSRLVSTLKIKVD
ncbi:MAG TPA: tripartite tricarboxylate transporter substrate binding protein [Ramlibacter sp.]|nr:tripartite tricarboxylate transporter substrate binding protein [Ramlibacter sp.]